MTDTRPTLTARWRALERKGWEFSIESRFMYMRISGDLEDRALLVCTHAKHDRGINNSVSIPLSEHVEMDMLNILEGVRDV